MSSKITLKILKNLINLGHDIDRLLDDSLIIEIVKDETLSDEFFNIVKMEDSKVKKYLKIRRDTFPYEDEYGFEKKLLLNMNTSKGFGMFESVFKVIPERHVLKDEAWLENLLTKQKRVFYLLNEKQKSTLEGKEWYLNKLIKEEIGIRVFSSQFPWHKLDITKGVLSNSLNSINFIPSDILRTPEVFNHILDNLESKKGKWEKLLFNYSSSQQIIKSLQILISVFSDYENNPEKYTEDLTKTMTFKNYRTSFIAVGCVHPKMNTSDLIKTISKRERLLNKVTGDDSKYINFVDELVKDIPEKAYEDSILVNHIGNYLKKLLTNKKISVLKINNFNSFIEMVNPLIESRELQNIVKDMKERRYGFLWNKSTKLVDSGSFEAMIEIVNKIQIYLLEDMMLKEAPVSNIKPKVVKF